MNCGNKAETLIELQEMGINVPNFITTGKEFFVEFMKLCQVYEEAQLVVVKSAWLKEIFKNIVKGIELANVDSEVLKLLGDKIKNLEFPIAVRSSCSIEDSTKESCAGLFHTELGIENSELVFAIKKVVASLYDYKCLMALNKQSFHPEQYFMGMVIQEMLEPQWSGVAFSKDPVSGDDDIIIIQAVNGLGEDLVSGKEISEHIVVNKNSKISENKIIKDELIDEIKAILIRLEKHYGYAVDIEWAIQDNKLYILQCRPITTIKEVRELESYVLFSMSKLNEENYELLAGLKSRYKRWVKKARFYKFCEEKNLLINKWNLFAFSRKNLENVDYNELLKDYKSPYIIYHLNNKFLSVCRKENLKEVIETYVSQYYDKQYCISIRESLPNIISAISQVNSDNKIQVEVVSGKMSMLNNGIVLPTMYIIDFEGNMKYKAESFQELYRYDEDVMDIINTKVSKKITLSEEMIKYIANNTKRFKEHFGSCSIEWWIWGNEVYAADMSVLSIPLDTKEGRIISEGKVTGILRSFPKIDEETAKNLNMFSEISVSDTEFDVNQVETFAKIPAISLLGSDINEAVDKEVTVNAYEGIIQKR